MRERSEVGGGGGRLRMGFPGMGMVTAEEEGGLEAAITLAETKLERWGDERDSDEGRCNGT